MKNIFMADDQNHLDTLWPMPMFRFEVDLNAELKGIRCQEILGLDTPDLVSYRAGDSKLNKFLKMPGFQKFPNVTMKKLLFPAIDGFWTWYRDAGSLAGKQTVLIRLLDEKGNTTLLWQLDNAWPSKIAGADFHTGQDEISVETVELRFEKMATSI